MPFRNVNGWIGLYKVRHSNRTCQSAPTNQGGIPRALSYAYGMNQLRFTHVRVASPNMLALLGASYTCGLAPPALSLHHIHHGARQVVLACH